MTLHCDASRIGSLHETESLVYDTMGKAVAEIKSLSLSA